MATGRFLVFVFLTGVLLFSCSLGISPERAANAHIAQKKWSAAESDLHKAFRKDTLNVEAKFIYAQYFLSNGNPAFNPDSAHVYTQRTLAGLALSTPKQRERLHKIPVDSATIFKLQSRVDIAAFAKAQRLNSPEAYQHFIFLYPKATDLPEAIELRDEVAYLDALRKNTPAAFKQYVAKYPDSRRVSDAEERYEQLIYKERTASGNVENYKSFLKQFPQSIYRNEAEKFIFETTTSSGLIEDYLNFIKQYANGSQSSKAKNILYYLMRDADIKRPAGFDNDSLRMLDERNKGYWVPFYKNGLYGFMNDDGVEVMEPRFEAIDSSYLCGEITLDFLVTSAGVFSRSGALLLKKTPTSTIDMGNGFLALIDGHCQTIVHQSGFQIGDNCALDGRIVADQFMSLKEKKGWALYALNSKLLLPPSYDEIRNVDKVIVLKRYGKNIVVKASQVAAVTPTKPLDESLVFDEVRAWGEGNLWVKNGILEGVIGQDLKFVIPLDRQVLVKTSFGFTRKKDSKLQVRGVSPSLEAQFYDEVRDYGDWLELVAYSQSTLYRVSQKKVVATDLDSVWIKNRVAFGVKLDSLNAYTGSNRLASFERSAPITFIKSNDSIVYFWVSEKKNKVVFEASQGRKLFSSEFDDIEAINRDFFIFTKNNKKGLFRRDGKIVLPAEFDAVIPTSAGYLSLLKDKKFGLYDTKNQKLIKPQYERNVLPYAQNYFVAYKDGYGIITASEEPVTGFDFEEIKYWNDTSAWVKKNFTWSILSIEEKTLSLSKIRSFQYIKDHDDEKIVRVQQDNYFGIVSNKNGVIISPTFTEIINVGSDEKPFYFTEKHVEEADIYVVIYYNSKGKLVRKQVYEEDEYEKIYCEN
jgi:hypothetical protein